MSQQAEGPAPESSGIRLLEVVAVATLALGLRLVQLDAIEAPDDYFQYFAARAWLAEGTLGIAGGEPYDRARLYTYLIAGFMHLFGETTWVARFPAALAGAGCVALLFVWLRAHVGRTAAWIGALLFCVDPWSIAFSRYIRFYTLHGLVFLAVAIGVYYLVTRAAVRPRSAVIALAVLAGLAVAYHLQVTTVVGVLALGAWAAVDLVPRAVRLLTRQPAALAAGGLVAGTALLIGAGALLVYTGLAAEQWQRFRSVPLWASEKQDELGYYFRRLRHLYGALWALFPAAVVIAVARAGRPALFAGVLFSVPFVLHSLAAFKGERFLSYALPFLFATWGIALAAVLPALGEAAATAAARVTGGRAGGRVARAGAWVLLAAAASGLLYTTPAVRQSYKLVRPGVPHTPASRPDWRAVSEALAGAQDSVDVVVGARGVQLLYHFGRVDVEVGDDPMPIGGAEFSQARQIGRPVITRAESIETLIRCYRSGLVIVPRGFWGAPAGAPEPFTAVVEAHAERLPLPEAWGILAFRWSRNDDGADPPGADCPAVGGAPPALRPPRQPPP